MPREKRNLPSWQSVHHIKFVQPAYVDVFGWPMPSEGHQSFFRCNTCRNPKGSTSVMAKIDLNQIHSPFPVANQPTQGQGQREFTVDRATVSRRNSGSNHKPPINEHRQQMRPKAPYQPVSALLNRLQPVLRRSVDHYDVRASRGELRIASRQTFGVSSVTTVSPPFFRASSTLNSARLIKSVTISSLS